MPKHLHDPLTWQGNARSSEVAGRPQRPLCSSGPCLVPVPVPGACRKRGGHQTAEPHSHRRGIRLAGLENPICRQGAIADAIASEPCGVRAMLRRREGNSSNSINIAVRELNRPSNAAPYPATGVSNHTFCGPSQGMPFETPTTPPRRPPACRGPVASMQLPAIESCA